MPIPNAAAEEHRDTPMLLPLPLPGAPSSSWAQFHQRLKTIFSGVDFRVCFSFWLCGLINNVLYVVILSAALDLVGPNVPKGVVLLADVIPSFGMKLIAPYFIHAVPYSVRILIFVVLSAAGMLLVAASPSYVEGGTISSKIAGIILASLSSGGGEMSFVGLTHFYGPFSLASWGSGTGAAGLVGAGAYTLATTSLGFSVRTAILAFACLPAVMVVSFFIILPETRLRYASPVAAGDYQSIVERGGGGGWEERGDLRGQGEYSEEGHGATAIGEENDYLLSSSGSFGENHKSTTSLDHENSAWKSFRANLRRARGLFVPFMFPLLLVYIAEYTINQGVSPNLLFPLNESPFSEFREFYPMYNAIYQVINLAVLALHALFDFIPSVYIVFAIIFWEGLLGGLVYVNTFAEIGDRVPEEDREFSLGATTVSDSGGICIAGFLSMAVEVWLCNYQDAHGRDYCRKI